MTVAVPDAPGLKEVICGRDRDDIGGFATIEVHRDGPRGHEVVQRVKTHNLVVNSGKVQIWRLAQGTQARLFDQFRIGTSGAAANSGHTNVLSPVPGTLNTADSMTVLAATRMARWTISYPSGAGTISATDIQEVVLLNENTSPGGSAMMRTVFSVVAKKLTDKLKITYEARIA